MNYNDLIKQALSAYEGGGWDASINYIDSIVNRPKFEFLGQETGWEVRQH